MKKLDQSGRINLSRDGWLWLCGVSEMGCSGDELEHSADVQVRLNAASRHVVVK